MQTRQIMAHVLLPAHQPSSAAVPPPMGPLDPPAASRGAGFTRERLGCFTPCPEVSGAAKRGQQVTHCSDVIACVQPPPLWRLGRGPRALDRETGVGRLDYVAVRPISALPGKAARHAAAVGEPTPCWQPWPDDPRRVAGGTAAGAASTAGATAGGAPTVRWVAANHAERSLARDLWLGLRWQRSASPEDTRNRAYWDRLLARVHHNKGNVEVVSSYAAEGSSPYGPDMHTRTWSLSNCSGWFGKRRDDPASVRSPRIAIETADHSSLQGPFGVGQRVPSRVA
jgi:hypothetical protein